MNYNIVLRKHSVEHTCLARLELPDAVGVRGSRRPHVRAGHGNTPLFALGIDLYIRLRALRDELKSTLE